MPARESGIYCITVNRGDKSPKFYIGQSVVLRDRKSTHFRELSRGISKNKAMQAAYKKYGASSFCFSVIARCIEDKSLLSSMEKVFFDHYARVYGESSMYNVNREEMTSGAGVKRSEETRARMRKAWESRVVSAETIERLRDLGKSMVGKTLSAETIAKRTESQKGVKRSDEWKSLMSIKMTGRTHSEETRKKISETKKAKGIKPTNEHMEMLRKKAVGRKMSEETKEKIRASKIGKKKPVEEILRRQETRRHNAEIKYGLIWQH